MTPESRQRVSTRLAFLAAGMGMSAWAALVPFAKDRLGLEPARLGLLLLCLGAGSLIAMPLTGVLASRFGCRRVVVISGGVACLVLPLLSVASNSSQFAGALFVFGAALGTLDVAMNIQAVIVEKAQGGALMSGFHGLFSAGGVAGAGGMALLLWTGLSPLAACLVMTIAVAVALGLAAPGLLRKAAVAEEKTHAFAVPHGAVVLIGLLCAVVFLAEGAMLDWSGLLLTGNGFSADQGGIGYAVFAVAMTLGRLTGDRVVRRWGRKHVLLVSGLCAAAGFFIAVVVAVPGVALCGFLFIGIGASNIVPILFTAAGNQKAMPAGMAVSAITTLGYAGILAGPAAIGFIAHVSSLNFAFACIGVAMLLVAATSRLEVIP